MYSQIQSLLLKKLPRLGELTFGCEVKQQGHEAVIIGEWGGKYLTDLDLMCCDTIDRNFLHDKNEFEILGHPFTHADLLEALGENWAMTGDYQLLRKEAGRFIDSTYIFEADNQGFEKLPKLPLNISDLSLPKYEETREKLISLLK